MKRAARPCILALALLSLLLTLPIYASAATAQLWLDDHLTLPVPVESQAAVDFYLYELARMTPCQPTADELLEQGVVLKLPAPDGTFYRYTFYKGGLVACQVGGDTLWYQCPPLSSLRAILLGCLTEAWAPPPDAKRTLPLLEAYQVPPFTGDRDALVDLQWARAQIKVFDPKENYTVYIEPGSYDETIVPIEVTDKALRAHLLEMVSDINFTEADRRLYMGMGTYIWVVKGDERHLYEVSGNMVFNYQVPGVLKCTYDGRKLGDDLLYIRAAEYYRLRTAGK